MFHAVQDDNYNKAIHYLTGMQQLADEVVRYDLDDLDVCWLQRMNEERITMGDIVVHEWTMERVMEELETQVCSGFPVYFIKKENVEATPGGRAVN
jgi:hypothetical protein